MMIFTLCDIGNTHFHFYQNGRIWHTKKLNSKENLGQIFYISVNDKATQSLLIKYPNAIDLAPMVEINTVYKGLGIDRKTACKVVKDGVIIDAGSAITIDIMRDGYHLGGYILPGIGALNDLYKSISPNLRYPINTGVDLNALPQDTSTAISYGCIKSIYCVLKDSIKTSKKTYFLGGDGKFLSKFFDNSIYDETLIFKGMISTLKEKNLITGEQYGRH